MLSGCSDLLVITEGINNAALFYALIGVEKPYYHNRNILDAVSDLQLCMSLREWETLDIGVCASAVGVAQALKETRQRLDRVLRTALKTLTGSPGLCILFLFDSNDGVEAALKRVISTMLSRLDCRIICSTRRYAAAECKGDIEARILVMVWKCCSECWIAGLAGRDEGGLEGNCNSIAREKCHEFVKQELSGLDIVERTHKVSDMMRQTPHVSKVILEKLKEFLLDGEHT